MVLLAGRIVGLKRIHRPLYLGPTHTNTQCTNQFGYIVDNQRVNLLLPQSRQMSVEMLSKLVNGLQMQNPHTRYFQGKYSVSVCGFERKLCLCML